ncbi:MAG TPA: hypothetical protein VN036_08980 [Devosia sp.]|nr:hypothetical protein [Devosia sp.]
MRFASSLVLAAVLLAAPALAGEDAETGLAVTLPDAFVVEAAPSPPPYNVTFGVKSASDDPATLTGEKYLCQVSFQSVPANAGLTRERINEQIGSPGWIAMAKDGMSSIFDFVSDSSFKLDGYKGHEFIGMPKQKNAEHVRLVLSMVETAKGRTAVSCVTDAERLDAVLPTFHTIRDGVTPPA